MVHATQTTTPEMGVWGWTLVPQIKNWSAITRDKRMDDEKVNTQAHTHTPVRTHGHLYQWCVAPCDFFPKPFTIANLLTVIIMDQCILVGSEYSTELKLLSSALGLLAHTMRGEIFIAPQKTGGDFLGPENIPEKKGKIY